MGDDGPRRVGLLERPLHPSVEDRLVPRRQLLAGEYSAAGSPSVALDADVDAAGSLCAHHIDDRRVVAELIDGMPAPGRTAWRAHASGVPPLQREVLPAAACPSSSAASYSRTRAMWPWTRSRSSPASTGELDVATQLAGVASASASTRSGARLAPFRNSRSPLTEHTQSFAGDLAQPGADVAAVAQLAVDDHLDATSVSGWSPSDHGHHSAGFSMSRFQLTSLSPRRATARTRRSGRRRPACGRATLAASSQSSRASRSRCGRGRRRRRGTAHGTGRRAPGRCRTRRTGRHRPPGFQSRSMPSQCWNTPGDVALARAVALRCARHLDGEDVLVAEPRQRR